MTSSHSEFVELSQYIHIESFITLCLPPVEDRTCSLLGLWVCVENMCECTVYTGNLLGAGSMPPPLGTSLTPRCLDCSGRLTQLEHFCHKVSAGSGPMVRAQVLHPERTKPWVKSCGSYTTYNGILKEATVFLIPKPALCKPGRTLTYLLSFP